MTRGIKWTLAIAGAAVVLIIGLAVFFAAQPEKKTCEEWIAHAMTTDGFESNIGPACLWGPASEHPEKEYTLDELNQMSDDMPDPEGGILGELPEHEWQD